MGKLKLTYFDINGGRGETARLAMTIGKVPFEDNRISFEKFTEIRDQFPSRRVPVLEVDGEVVTQSNAINRYVAKLSGLYPEDPHQALLCDEILESVEDMAAATNQTIFLKGDELVAARQRMVKNVHSIYLRRFNDLLSLRGEWFVGDRLTVADLAAFVGIKGLQRGILEHVPADIVSMYAPKLVEHYERILNTPAVKAYYSKR